MREHIIIDNVPLLIFNGQYAQTNQIFLIFPQLKKTVITKRSVCKIINLKLFLLIQ
jgi:hypothetical protein